MPEGKESPRRSRLVLVAYVLVALAALPVRARALVENPTPDAAEYELIARSLARGDGYVLPVRVRHDETGPAVHSARGERAPLFPLFLSVLERVGLDDGRGGFALGLQLANALVGTIDAVLAAALAAALARRRMPSSEKAEALVALAAGVVTAWSPPLVHTSVRILSEPLGLFFLLLAARAEVSLSDESAGENTGRVSVLALLSGLAIGLARLARPEMAFALLVLVILRVAAIVRREKGAPVALAATVAGAVLASGAAHVLGVAAPPQTFLLRVSSFMDVMYGFDNGKTEAPAASVLDYVSTHPGTIARNVVGNALDYVGYWFKNFWTFPVCAGVALGRAFLSAMGRAQGTKAERRIAFLGWGLLLGAILVWSTRDRSRFTAAPFALLAGPAVLEGACLLGHVFKKYPGLATPPGKKYLLAVVVALVWAARPLDHERGELMKTLVHPPADVEDLWHGPHLEAIGKRLRSLPEGRSFAAVSPWGIALASGKPGVLLPNELSHEALGRFLDQRPDIAVVILRPDIPHEHPSVTEPMGYAEDLAPISSSEDVAGAKLIWLAKRNG